MLCVDAYKSLFLAGWDGKAIACGYFGGIQSTIGIGRSSGAKFWNPKGLSGASFESKNSTYDSPGWDGGGETSAIGTLQSLGETFALRRTMLSF